MYNPGNPHQLAASPPVPPPRIKRRSATVTTATAVSVRQSAVYTHRPLAGMKSTNEREYKRLLVAIQPVWPAVARLMQFSESDIDKLIPDLAFRFDLTAAEALLQLWGDQLNHNLTELFVLLGRAKMYEAMRAVQHLVPDAYLVCMPSPPPPPTTTATNNNGAADAGAVAATAANVKKLNIPISNEENASVPRPAATTATVAATDDDEDLRNRLASYIPFIAHDELLTATRNWSSHNVLGAGGFGTVYSGRWKQTMVAIKRIKSATLDRESLRLEQQQGLNELRHLNACRHDNILPLYGYSLEPNGDPCLVYQLMVGGSLERRLAGKADETPPLQWYDRMVVALGTAKGLQYLHTVNSIPIIHGDIKPANILLDECCRPKIGDFGLTRFGEHDDADFQVSRIYGTRHYLPDEVTKSRTLSTKVDTYSFGIVLLELATGLRVFRPAYGHLVDKIDRTKNHAELMPQLTDDGDAGYTFRSLLGVGKDCTARDSNERPEMVTVSSWLEGMFKCKMGTGMRNT